VLDADADRGDLELWLIYTRVDAEDRSPMLSRRAALASLAGLIAAGGVPWAELAQAGPPAAGDPLASVNAIYARVIKGKGDLGGTFVIDRPTRSKYLSKALILLWDKADAATPKGDVGPVDFDPVTNSQDPDVASFTANAEKQGAASATIAVTLKSHREPRSNAADDVIRYDFVRDGAQWRIDDIRGATDGKPWSVRTLLSESLKQ
jgi:hypothetical protein